MTAPTASDVRDWSDVDFGSVGGGKLVEDTALQRLVDRAVAYVEWVTGRKLDASMPAEFEPVAEQAVQYVTENSAYQGVADVAETQGDFATIASFSAGSYSETRRAPADLAKMGLINADPRVHSLLWMLLTDEKRDQWSEWLTGQHTPDFSVTEPDWGVNYGGYDNEPRGMSWPPPSPSGDWG